MDPEPPKREDSRGRMKSSNSGRSPWSAWRTDAGCWFSWLCGLLLGRSPPNCCTLIPGPPPMLNTNPGPPNPPPKGPPPMPPKGPPIPPPKNCRNSSSGLISSSNIGPCGPRRCDAKPEKGEAPDAAEAEENRLSGSPPNLSYFDFLSASLSIWKALDTTAYCQSCPSLTSLMTLTTYT